MTARDENAREVNAREVSDSKSRALLATAPHPSSLPNERLMALAAFNRMLDRAGIHPSDIAIFDASRGDAPGSAGTEQVRETMRLETENIALARRIKAQEAALRRATREAEAAAREIATLRATIARREEALAEDACQIAALEADLATRDRRIATLEARLGHIA